MLAKSGGRKGFHTKIAREVKWKTNQKAVLQNRDYIQTFLGLLRLKKGKKRSLEITGIAKAGRKENTRET